MTGEPVPPERGRPVRARAGPQAPKKGAGRASYFDSNATFTSATSQARTLTVSRTVPNPSAITVIRADPAGTWLRWKRPSFPVVSK